MPLVLLVPARCAEGQRRPVRVLRDGRRKRRPRPPPRRHGAPAAPAESCPATPFDGAQYALAPHAGVVGYLQPVGARVAVGDPLFEVIDPLDDRHSIVRAETAGIVYARERLRFAQPGLWLVKVAGATPIRQGRLLSD